MVTRIFCSVIVSIYEESDTLRGFYRVIVHFACPWKVRMFYVKAGDIALLKIHEDVMSCLRNLVEGVRRMEIWAC